VLAFLSYKEKFLAGSWRFDTYFGRDTLMTLRLLMPVLQPPAVESGLLSVLTRLAPDGEVAHEEDVGEFAVLRHLRERGQASAAPIYDYGMIDGTFMLPPVLASYLLDRSAGRGRASALLDQRLPSGLRAGDALVRNLRRVVDQARPFAAQPTARNLVAIKPGRATGQWRDSQEGLGRGRYPYDVNVVFVPAALDATDRLVRSGLLAPYLSNDDRAALTGAGNDAAIWSSRAPDLFRVRIESDAARENIRNYAAAIGVSDGPSLSAVASRPIEFDALALDDAGRPVRVIHSDPGFSYLFGHPSAAEVERSLSAMMRPFPAGLMTDVGVVVANPVFADQRTQSTLGRNAYHGTVIWAWQEAVLIAGIERQLARQDLPAALKARLSEARARIRATQSNTREVRTSELWSWAFSGGRYRVAPFGAQAADEDESNAAQLWSTVTLAH
jgi:glycogen debranching enzyme